MAFSRGLVRIALVLCAGASWVALIAQPASAHAAYKDSDPADESMTSAPSEVWAEFTEPPAEGSYLQITHPCGTQVDDRNSSIDGYRIYIGMHGDISGTYTAAVGTAGDGKGERPCGVVAVERGDDGNLLRQGRARPTASEVLRLGRW